MAAISQHPEKNCSSSGIKDRLDSKQRKTKKALDSDQPVDSIEESPIHKPKLPEFTFKNFATDIIQAPFKLLLSPLNFALVAIPLWLFDSILLKFIVANVSYTEIDYSTYMQQVAQFWSGERDYAKIEGDSGPLVYPAGHLWIYTAIKWLSGEDKGKGAKKSYNIWSGIVGKKFSGKKHIPDIEVGIVESVKKNIFNGVDGMQNVSAAQHVFRWVYLYTLAVVLIGYCLINYRVPSKGSGFKFIDDEVRGEENSWADSPSNGNEKLVKPKKKGSGKLWGMAPYLLIILISSKRLHSIYVLRLFNDCFVTLFMVQCWVCILASIGFKRSGNEYALQKELNESSTEPSPSDNATVMNVLSTVFLYLSMLFYSLALSVKMNALLFLPGYMIVGYLLSNENFFQFLIVIAFGLEVQLAVNWPFISAGGDITKHFFQNAFDFGRIFMYKWTVNWKFIPESIFLANYFHLVLLVIHVAVLLWFVLTKYLNIKNTGKSLRQFIIKDGLLAPFESTLDSKNIILSNQAEVYATYILFSSNLIGILFCRSLHYQFLCWYHWTLPFLLHTRGFPWYVNILLATIHELCWNQYPSTALSSAALMATLATTLC